MTVTSHDQLPVHETPRIKTRILAGAGLSAKQTEVWEQWIEPDGYIPPHYHEVEEVLVFLEGEISITLGEQTSVIQAPATAIIPANQIHGLRPSSESRVHLLAIFPVSSPKIFAPDGGLRPLPWEDFERRKPL